MGSRRITALAAATVMVVAACGGGGGSSTLSEDDFLDELADVCTGAQRSFDRIDEPESLADVEGASEEAIEILEGVKDDLDGIAPPEDYADDFDKLQQLVDDQIEQYGELRDAAADEDENAALDVVAELDDLESEQRDLAADLDSEDCAPEEDTPTTDAPPVTDATLPTVTTVADTVAPTLPPTVPPVITTAPPVITTAPPVITTAPPVPSGGISIDSVTANFNPPTGYSMIDTAGDLTQTIVDGMSLDPVLGSSVDVIGVADLIEASGTTVARLFISFTPEGGTMPTGWSDYFCPAGQGTPITTPGEFVGVVCTLDDGSGGVQNFFASQGGTAGFAILTVDPNLDLPTLVDAFFAANPG